MTRHRILALMATVIAGCTSGQRSSVATENTLAESVDKLGLTQLATAPAVRRVLAGPKVDLEVRPSPDGRSFSMTDWSTGGVVLHDLASGTKRRVIENPGPPDETIGLGGNRDYAEETIISPDGKSIAYGWWVAQTDTWELRIAGLSGVDSGRVRTVYSLPGAPFLGAQAWTPDGREVISPVSPAKGSYQIAAIRSVGGGIRMLPTLCQRYPSDMAVSPDGRWIAYDCPTDGDRNAHVIDIDGRTDNVVARYKGDDAVLGWTGRDGRLLIMSDRSGVPSVWSLTVVDGKAIGEPVLVRSNMWRAAPAGTAANGSSFYSVSVGDRDVYTAAIDPLTRAIRSRGTSITGGNQASNPKSFAWSADGEYVAYQIWRGGSMHYYGPEDVIVRSVTRGEVRRLSPKMTSIVGIQWFHDGRAMLLFGKDDKGRLGIFRMEMEDASLKPLLLGTWPSPKFPEHPTFLADGKRIAFVTKDSSDILINLLDPESGKITEIRRIGRSIESSTALAFSHDGQSLAVAVKDRRPGSSRLIVARVDGGPEREVYRLPLSENFSWDGLAWMPNGRGLVFGVSSASSGSVNIVDIRRLSLDDNKVASIGAPTPNMLAFRISPDGRTLMYGVRRDAREMWMMDQPVFGPRASVAVIRK